MNDLEFLRESNAIEDVHDARSLEQAVYAWEYLKQQDKLTCDIVRKTHKILMLHQDLLPNEKGYFRKQKVFIGGREAMDSRYIRQALEEWLKDVEASILVPGEKDIKQDHINYEKIHPFIDGNGRTGRMFMNWEYLKIGEPIMIIHAGPEQLEYYKWFK